MQQVFEELKKYENVLSSIHVCRGNWTCDESVLLEGTYDELGSFFDSLDVNMLTLEFSTPRAGTIPPLFKNNRLSRKIMLGLGCLNPRNDIIETPESIVRLAEEAMEFLPPERIWLNPDCGFATFSNRPVNPYPVIRQKLMAMKRAKEILREKYSIT